MTGVGYAPTTLRQNGNVGAGCFVPVGNTETIDLMDITVTGYTGDTKGDVKVYLLDEDGATDAKNAMYAWYDYNDKGTQKTGWMLGRTWIKRTDVPLTVGAGLWITATAANFKLQSSGQVLGEEEFAPVILNNGSGMLVANPIPVSNDLMRCTISGYTGDTKGDVKAYILDEDGATDAKNAMYAWYDYNDKGTQKTGWMFGRSWVKDGDVPLAPGQGLWVTTTGAGFKFVFSGVKGL